MQPSQSRGYNCHKPNGIKLLTRFRVGLCHIRERKLKYSFRTFLFGYAIVS